MVEKNGYKGYGFDVLLNIGAVRMDITPPHRPSENGTSRHITVGRAAIATPPEPIYCHISFHLKILVYVN